MTNEINFTPEMLEQAKSAPSATALLTLAQENGITLTAEQAETYYTQFHPETGALSDEELDNVSGGKCGSSLPEICDICKGTDFCRVIKHSVVPYWKCKGCGKLTLV